MFKHKYEKKAFVFDSTVFQRKKKYIYLKKNINYNNYLRKTIGFK
jgi:hypothetical protein